MPWQPEEGDRVCLDHFISKKKSDLHNNLDYVPSVYPHETAKKKCSGNTNGGNLARFEQAQRHAAASTRSRLKRKGRMKGSVYLSNECFMVSNTIMVDDAASPIKHYVKVPRKVPVSSSCQMQASLITEVSQSSNVPVEIGRFVTFHDHLNQLPF